MAPPDKLPFTPDPGAQALLATNHTALLIGIVLYQQIPIEKAFAGPSILAARIGKDLNLDEIAAMDPAQLEKVFRERPAIHRFPANMAKRTQAVCQHVVDNQSGDPTLLWADVEDATEVIARLTDIPGFGDYKARLYLGVLAKWFDVRPSGWEDAVPDWPTIADVDSIDDLADLKARKKAWKSAAG